jgi:hypothetical protein
MTDDRFRELIRLVELDYERTAQFINGVLATGSTFRGWAVTIWLAVLGIAFSQDVWSLGLLASIVAIVFMLIDGYHAWLYTEAEAHANQLERTSAAYHEWLIRGADDPDRTMDFQVQLESYRFGLYRNLKVFRFRDFRHVRPRIVFRFFYPFLVVVGILAAIVVGVQGPKNEGSCHTVPKAPKNVIECENVVIVRNQQLAVAIG